MQRYNCYLSHNAKYEGRKPQGDIYQWITSQQHENITLFSSTIFKAIDFRVFLTYMLLNLFISTQYKTPTHT